MATTCSLINYQRVQMPGVSFVRVANHFTIQFEIRSHWTTSSEHVVTGAVITNAFSRPCGRSDAFGRYWPLVIGAQIHELQLISHIQSENESNNSRIMSVLSLAISFLLQNTHHYGNTVGSIEIFLLHNIGTQFHCKRPIKRLTTARSFTVEYISN